MPFQNAPESKCHAELLMDISATLADFTQSLRLAREIPAYLARTLGVEPLTLAIVQEQPGGAAPQAVLAVSSRPATEASAAACQADVMALYEQTRPRSQQDGPALSGEISTKQISADGAELAVQAELATQSVSESPRAVVFARAIDDHHRMLLIVHLQHDSHLSDVTAGLLQLIAVQLTKFLACLMTWNARPQDIGGPFQRLTDREWVVLRGLNSDAGEKQLADELGLSPHTLHSHIKSIYRKVGVQGRLPLLLRAENAMRNLRFGRLNQRSMTTRPAVSNLSVALG